MTTAKATGIKTAIDLFCGLGGWAEGFLAEGWHVVGFDIERHVYGAEKYPAQLVLQDVLTLHGRQFKDASCIVASPPCQFFSYCAMPWSRAKQLAADVRADPARLAKELALFNVCFRIQREACEAAGRHIPMVVENVKGAQPWVGPAKAYYGSFYLWGDVDMVGSRIIAGRMRFGESVRAARRGQKANPDGTNHGQGSWFKIANSKERGSKNGGGSWFTVAHNTESGHSQNPVHEYALKGFVTGLGRGHDWRQDPSGRFNSKSIARKAASAQIAKIPLPLASYIARSFA